MNPVFLVAVIAFVSTLLGGALILAFRSKLPYFFAFAAGSIIAVAFLDLLPETLEIAEGAGVSVRAVMITIVLAFFGYALLERFFATHDLHDHAGHESHAHDHDGHGHIMGPIGAGSLVLHSFFDGVAIGSAFLVSESLGIIVALAVIFHDFTDGINTVTVMLRNKQPLSRTIGFLVAGALAPVLGVALTTSIGLPPVALAYLLAVFIGEFLYIGAATLIPETKKTPAATMIAMGAGIFMIIILTSFLHG